VPRTAGRPKACMPPIGLQLVCKHTGTAGVSAVGVPPNLHSIHLVPGESGQPGGAAPSQYPRPTAHAVQPPACTTHMVASSQPPRLRPSPQHAQCSLPLSEHGLVTAGNGAIKRVALATFVQVQVRGACRHPGSRGGWVPAGAASSALHPPTPAIRMHPQKATILAVQPAAKLQDAAHLAKGEGRQAGKVAGGLQQAGASGRPAHQGCDPAL